MYQQRVASVASGPCDRRISLKTSDRVQRSPRDSRAQAHRTLPRRPTPIPRTPTRGGATTPPHFRNCSQWCGGANTPTIPAPGPRAPLVCLVSCVSCGSGCAVVRHEHTSIQYTWRHHAYRRSDSRHTASTTLRVSSTESFFLSHESVFFFLFRFYHSSTCTRLSFTSQRRGFFIFLL